jgi:SAM-dependent methyltransferase
MEFAPEDIFYMMRDKQKIRYLVEYKPETFWKDYGKIYRQLFAFPDKDGTPKKGYNNMHLDMQSILGRLDAIRPESLLEVGCGFGRCLAPIHTAFKDMKRIVGLELSETMIKSSKDFLDNYYRTKKIKDKPIEIICGEARELPFKDNEFDLILTHACLTHIPPEFLPQVTREISRVAKNWIIHLERFAYMYEHPNPHRWSHCLPPFYLDKGWCVFEYDLVPEHPKHNTKILVLKKVK